MKGAGEAIVPAVICSEMEAQEKGTGTGTKGHMAQSSQGVRQEPSGEKGGIYWAAWLPPTPHHLHTHTSPESRASFSQLPLQLSRTF